MTGAPASRRNKAQETPATGITENTGAVGGASRTTVDGPDGRRCPPYESLVIRDPYDMEALLYPNHQSPITDSE
jgi:hypothetical protein